MNEKPLCDRCGKPVSDPHKELCDDCKGEEEFQGVMKKFKERDEQMSNQQIDELYSGGKGKT